MTLDLLKQGDCVKLTQIIGESPLTARLLALGMTPGTRVICLGKAPFGDPVVLSFRGMMLALRTKDLQSIEGDICK